MSTINEPDQEILAITTVYATLKELDAPAQRRVVEYVLKKLNLTLEVCNQESNRESHEAPAALPHKLHDHAGEPAETTTDNELDGVSPVAQKWMRRNGLQVDHLSKVFSLGGDEIDLVAKTVPGKSTRARMHNVFLLKGVAAYLGGGAARFTHDQVKETCTHYDAFDGPNFSKHLKDFAADISGSKESGYTLTARGLTNATELVKEITQMKKAEGKI